MKFYEWRPAAAQLEQGAMSSTLSADPFHGARFGAYFARFRWQTELESHIILIFEVIELCAFFGSMCVLESPSSASNVFNGLGTLKQLTLRRGE